MIDFRMLLAALVLGGCAQPGAVGGNMTIQDGTEVRVVKTKFSTALVRDQGSVRSLYFLEPSGLAVRQTAVDLERPGRLIVPYTRSMFGTFLFKETQERVLIVGMGGGAMVRFLNHHFPATRVDAVEIDPAIVKIAREEFGTRAGRGTRIFTEDAFDYLRRDQGRYDVIYMDAFLEPGEETDARGRPVNLGTVDFLRSLERHLVPGGVVAFNVVEHPGYQKDLRAIRAAFSSVRIIGVPGTKNFSVIASPERELAGKGEAIARGRALDRKMDLGFSLEGIAGRMQP